MAVVGSTKHRLSVVFLVSSLSTFFSATFGASFTDTITWGGDVSRSGYQSNHNLDPSVVGSADFGQIFKTKLPGNFHGMGAEQIFAQPLVYTGKDGVQYVYVATTQNNLYKINGKTGAIIASRNLHVPFLTADLDNCVDINPLIGITATGVIDNSTGIWYFTAKTYADKFQDGLFSVTERPGVENARYYFHAVSTEDLSEAHGFPTLIDGTVFRNNPDRMFIGGIQHNRPALLQVNDYIYTGWASHCVLYNFTGAIIGFNKNNGSIVEAFALQDGQEPNTVPGAGVWMSGGGLAYDGKGSMYFASGNGYASQLKATGNAMQGRNPPAGLALEEAAINAKVNEDGTISVVDFFMPWEKTALDGADKDLGASPLEILPQDVFSCPNHNRIGVVTGKSGKTYWLDLDNLGGYQMGPNKQDAVIQVYQNENSVYAGAGVMPLDGGYVYINVIKFQTHVFKFSCNGNGDAVFAKVADTAEKNADILGVGHGTTTSVNGQPDSGLLWTSDVEGQNLRIYNAIPSGNTMTMIKAFNVPRVTKFSRPVFGDGRAYLGTTEGFLYAFGSPVNLPLNCSSPYQFGKVAVGDTSQPVNVTCVANIGTTITSLNVTGNKNFRISGSVGLPRDLGAGGIFGFQAMFAPNQTGPLSSDIVVVSKNDQSGYASNSPIGLKGTAYSIAPILQISPNTVSFNVIVGQSSTQPANIYNLGDSVLTFTNFSYSLSSEKGPWDTANTTFEGLQVGFFGFNNVPNSIKGDNQALLSITYRPTEAGVHKVFVRPYSDGGDAVLDVVGVAGSNPAALIEFQRPNGTGWITYTPGVPFSFGDVYQNQEKYLKMRITNNGSSTAVPLSITVSKPPFGLPGIVGAANNVDLAEGTELKAGDSMTASLYCTVPKSQVNLSPYLGRTSWLINTGDPNMGKQEIQFVCNAVTEQVGPLLGNGTARFPYIGCFKENNPGRQLVTQVYGDGNNTNGRCIDTCSAGGFIFAATQYNKECWCGNAIPILKDPEDNCNYDCTGDGNQICGGNGYFRNQAHMSLFADSTRFNGNAMSEPLHVVPSAGPFNFLGCYAESGAKTVDEKGMTSGDMTVGFCASYCAGFRYFGIEYSAECYCGNILASSSKPTDISECSMACKGSNSQFCGAGSRMQLYQANGTSTSPPSGPSSFVTIALSGSSTPTIFASSPITPSPIATSILACPGSNGTVYQTPNGTSYQIECYIDREGNDFPMTYTSSFELCIAACDAHQGCEDVSWVAGGPCYLKSAVRRAYQNKGVWGARAMGVLSSTMSPMA